MLCRSRALHRPARSAAFGSSISFYFIPRHLPWCHFCSPELACVPRVSLKKWGCIIYQGSFQLLSNLPPLFFFPLLFFRVSLLLFTYLPPRDSLCCSQRFASLITSSHSLYYSLLLFPHLLCASLAVSSGASFAGFHPLCLFPSEDLGALFLPNSPIGCARRRRWCGAFVSSLAPHIAVPTAQLWRSRATMAGSEKLCCVKQCRLHQMALRCRSSLVAASQSQPVPHSLFFFLFSFLCSI